MATLLIVKEQGQEGNFSIYGSDFGRSFLSDGYWTILNNKFQIEKLNGGKYPEYDVPSVTVRDDSSGTTGTPFTFTNENDLKNKLIELRFLIDIEMGELTQDQLNAINAANNPTAGNPFATIADIAGIYLQKYNKVVKWNTGDSLIFAMASGASIQSVMVNRILLYAAKDPDNIVAVEWTQTGNNVTLQNVVGTMLIEGDDNMIQFSGTI